MKLDTEFIKLPLTFDVERMRVEVEAIPESDWRPHPQGHPGNSALPLIALNGDPMDDGVAGTMLPTPHLEKCEYLRQVLVITVLIGIPLGVITGSGQRSWTNSLVRFLSVVGVGMPVFWSGLLLQLIFFGKLGWFPLDGRLSAGATPPPRLTHRTGQPQP